MIRPFSLILLLGALLVDAAPIGTLHPRQDVTIMAVDQPLTAPKTFQTVSQTQTSAGMVTLTCQVTQTPLNDPSGQNLIREEKSCMITVQGGSQNPQNPPDPNNGATSTITLAPTSDANNGGGGQTAAPAPAPAPTDTSGGAQASGTTLTIPPSTSLMTGSMAGSGVANGPSSTTSNSGSATSAASSSSTSAASTTAAPTSTAGAGGNNGSNNNGGTTNGGNGGGTGGATPSTPLADVGSVGTSLVPVSSLPTAPSNGVPVNGTAAAAEATTPAPFELPGRQIAVLPIGLGVFAGISVIALIVVGLVTYERTKYRKAFRQRKLAEAGAGMGYGGMAERA